MHTPRGIFALLVSLLLAAAAVATTMPAGLAAAGATAPPSGDLVLAEVMTGGVSASDEYIELANAGSADADLGGCELVYVTASGSTVTRKASFAAPLILTPGQHLLVANAAGIYGPLADATYTGGLAADGGVVVLRRLDGAVIDAVGWGTAANSYVEGTAAPAPPAKSSLERLPGGSGGNYQDTNDNRTDWFIQPNPVPQSLASQPVQGPSASPSGAPSGSPGAAPATATSATSATATPATSATSATVTSAPTAPATATGTPTAPATATAAPTAPAATATAAPTAPATATATAAPTAPAATATTAPTAPAESAPAPTATPEATITAPATTPPTATSSPIHTKTPTAPPATTPTATPTDAAPDLMTIAMARALPVGGWVHVSGAITAEVGLVGEGLLAIQDETGGIFVRASGATADLTDGHEVEVTGVLAAPYGQLEIRDLDQIVVGPDGKGLPATPVGLGEIGEGTEGSLVTIGGTVDSIQTDAGRLTVTVISGSAAVRVLADPPVGLSRADVIRGDQVVVTGVVGQRATATGRLDGYRLWPRCRADLIVQTPEPTQISIPAPTTTSVYYDLASALGTRGAQVDVEAVVTATAGLLDVGGPTIVVDDSSAAVAVVLPAGVAAPRVGMRVRVVGKVGRWEGGPTVLAARVDAEGELAAIDPRSSAGPLGASQEWQLVRVCGRVERYTPAGARWRLEMLVGGHEVVVLGEPSAGISMSKSAVGRLAVVVGIVRRSTSDASAFQLLPRMGLDVRLGPAPVSAANGSDAAGVAAARASGSATAAAKTTIEIGSAAEHLGETVTVAGLVVSSEGGTATLEDGSGEIRIGGSAAADAISMLEPGDAVEVGGVVLRDDQGLLIEVDPESMVAMPAGGSSASDVPAGAGTVGRLAGNPAATAASSVAAPDALRRAATGLAIPAPVPVLAALLLMVLLAACGAWLAARRRRRPDTSAITRCTPRRPNRGSGERR
jgi:uncharacterized protein YdeI (BOF family)